MSTNGKGDKVHPSKPGAYARGYDTIGWSKGRVFAKHAPRRGQKNCPWEGVAYSCVPGYVEGYGCPVCKGISFHHLPISEH